MGTYTLVDPLEISGDQHPRAALEAAAILERARPGGDAGLPDLRWRGREPGIPRPLRGGASFLTVTASPYNSGQLTVHPLRHVLRHSDLDGRERGDLWRLARTAASAVHERLRAARDDDRLQIRDVPGEHLALQVIPRWSATRTSCRSWPERGSCPSFSSRPSRGSDGRLDAQGRCDETAYAEIEGEARTRVRGAPGWLITLLLFVVIGFFAVSIYLGAPPRRASRAAPSGPRAARPSFCPSARSRGRLADARDRERVRPVRLGRKGGTLAPPAGIDVFETRNADSGTTTKTIVVARSSRAEAAKPVVDCLQKTLGIGLLIQERVAVPEADVILILGRDFPDSLPVFR